VERGAFGFNLVEGAPVYLAGAVASFAARLPHHLRRLVLSENETAPHHHMKKLFAITTMSIFLVAQQAGACPFCYGAKDGKSTEHMAVAIWFLFGAVMSVIVESGRLVSRFGNTADAARAASGNQRRRSGEV